MCAWQYDFVITETGDRPLIDLRVDVPTMERLEDLLDCRLEGRDPETPKGEKQLDLQDYRDEGEEPEIVYAELSRRMGVPRTVAETLGRQVPVSIDKPGDGSNQWRDPPHLVAV